MVEPGVATRPAALERILVVGYGNRLRGDDGLGPLIVDDLRDMAAMFGENFQTMVLPQLDVTLASEMTGVSLAIFVDARADEDKESVKVKRVFPAMAPLNPRHTSHLLGIPDLLRMALHWFGSRPVCYAVMPKGYDFSLSENISPSAKRAAKQAIRKIVEIIRRRAADR